MNYTDYRTGKPITREQYIANGMERGELLYSYDCGCVILQDGTADAYIVYCYKHEAAPDMYEACESVSKWLEALINTGNAKHPLFNPMKLALDKALAKAKGGK